MLTNKKDSAQETQCLALSRLFSAGDRGIASQVPSFPQRAAVATVESPLPTVIGLVLNAVCALGLVLDAGKGAAVMRRSVEAVFVSLEK